MKKQTPSTNRLVADNLGFLKSLKVIVKTICDLLQTGYKHFLSFNFSSEKNVEFEFEI